MQRRNRGRGARDGQGRPPGEGDACAKPRRGGPASAETKVPTEGVLQVGLGNTWREVWLVLRRGGSGARRPQLRERERGQAPAGPRPLPFCEAGAVGDLGWGGGGDTSPEVGLSAKDAGEPKSAERSPWEHSEFSS